MSIISCVTVGFSETAFSYTSSASFNAAISFSLSSSTISSNSSLYTITFAFLIVLNKFSVTSGIYSSNFTLSIFIECSSVICVPLTAPIAILKIEFSSLSSVISKITWYLLYSPFNSTISLGEYGLQSLSLLPSLWIVNIIDLSIVLFASRDNTYFFPFSSFTLLCLSCIFQSASPVSWISILAEGSPVELSIEDDTLDDTLLSANNSHLANPLPKSPFVIKPVSSILTLSI